METKTYVHISVITIYGHGSINRPLQFRQAFSTSSGVRPLPYLCPSLLPYTKHPRAQHTPRLLLPPGGARPGGRGRGTLLLGLLLDSTDGSPGAPAWPRQRERFAAVAPASRALSINSTASSSGSSAAAIDLEAQPVLGELVRVNDVGRARPPARLLEAALKPARVFKASAPRHLLPDRFGASFASRLRAFVWPCQRPQPRSSSSGSASPPE